MKIDLEVTVMLPNTKARYSQFVDSAEIALSTPEELAARFLAPLLAFALTTLQIPHEESIT